MDFNQARTMPTPASYGQIPEAVQDMKDTPLNRLLHALDQLEQAAQLAYETTDRLCGSQPTEAGKPSQEPSPAGMFAAVTLSANRIDRMASLITDCMHRINRVAG